ncbi:Macrolide export ATP-binding/permease protein MacB [Austwickia sp. TVS 96-490-7B]|uniref:ABC transporter ATP-binding protein n=1 Tax=Austwickia sp. TVS 96-490-7B TaxID=2830843 RepID=UPI001C55BD31|nr:ABC transporter ATP-binding protein [Austwickia sp. TVS 96-490-7B]MBW3084482.1 Macrolide export ATP-binding/permease protein MacB [Austwickia sp. TVS 96-490-7B]
MTAPSVLDASSSRTAVVRMRGVSRCFPPDVMALRDIDLDIIDGETLAVVGSSGSGKSTLLNLLGLLDVPTSGTYHLAGQDVHALPAGQRARYRANTLGFVFQAFHLVTHLTVEENVLLAARMQPRDRRRSAAAHGRRLLSELGLAHRAHAFPATLSGGERQRTAVARALCTRPALLLCDEPTGNLDQRSGARVIDCLLHARERHGTTVVVVTHDSQVAARMERQIHLEDGQVMAW